MKKMFRTLALLGLALAAVMTLAACEKKADPAPNPSATDPGTIEGKEYKIASDNGFAPFEFLDVASNSYIGFDMDIVAAIAEDQGFKYKMDNVGFDAARNAVQAGQADAMIAGMSIDEERKLEYDFSDGYFVDGQILVVGANSEIKTLEDLRGKSVAVKISTAGLTYAESIKAEYGFTTVAYEESPTMYEAVMLGTNVACFEDSGVADWAIKKNGLALQTIGEVISPKDYGFAVKKGSNPELIEMFNKGLENIKANGKYDEIAAKYGL